MTKILPALTAVGSACSLVAGPALSLELGELTVESRLGQPLRASIAYVLQPHEQLHDYCISLRPGPTASGLPGLSRATIAVAGDAIRLTGSVPIREPMLGLQLSINCPYTPNLQREYAMFVDPQPVEAETAAVSERPPVQEPAASSANNAEARPSIPRRTARAALPAEPVAADSRYLVQPGDSLSAIVARINDRPPGLWPAVYAVYDANPHAFIDGDMNLLKAGSWLTIPDLHAALGREPAPVIAAATAADAPPPAVTAAAYDGPPAQSTVANDRFDSGFAAGAATAAPEAAVVADTAQAAPTSTAAIEAENYNLRAGDIVLDDDGAFVESGDAAATAAAAPAPDTAMPARSQDAVTVTRDSSRVQTGSWSWLAWLGGAGIAVFLGLLLFGRQVRERFGSTPISRAPARAPERRQAEPARAVAAPAAVDFDFDADPSSLPMMSLDADLELGTGLRRATDIDVAQDFGFSARHDFEQEMDLELPEAAEHEPDQPTTSIIPPHRMAEPSILESEIPPSDDDDDEEYDLSMIVDATREPIVDTRMTAKDLKAVPVGMAGEDDEPAEYTLSREVDYKILEQDYQEEFTTTQALNAEIAKAAMELAETMAGSGSREDTSELPYKRRESDHYDDKTAEMPARGSLEITAELTGNVAEAGDAVNDDIIGDLDDTGVNEELTAELLGSDHDVTAEMAVEGGRVNTKHKRVS